MNHSSIRVVATAASPLLKPDVRISRIRLSQGRFAERHAPRTSRLGQSAESSPQENGWQSHNGSKLQVNLFPFCEHMSLAEALRSTGITRRPHCRVGGGVPQRWPPSAAQTGRAVFPHPAFTKARLTSRVDGRNQEDKSNKTHLAIKLTFRELFPTPTPPAFESMRPNASQDPTVETC